MTSVTINPGDGADLAALINAALADPEIDTVILGEGLFVLHSPIFIPSGKTLMGAGRDLTMLQAAEGFDRVSPGEGDGVVNTELGATGVTLSDFSIDANKLMPDGTRLVGCFMKQANDFSVSRVDVYNASAYAHFAQGNANQFTSYASGTYDDCAVYNSQIAFEQMYCDGVTLTDCRAEDGDGDLVGVYFHPLTGSKNITYINCSATGYGDLGFELTGNVYALENIRIIGCTIEMLGDGAAMVVAGEFPTFNLEIEGSSFIAHGNSAALLYGAQGTAVDSYFQGQAIGIAFFDSPLGVQTNFVVTNSDVLGLNDPAGGSAAFGVSTSGGSIVWDGGSIEARGPALIPISGPLTVTPGTAIVMDGFDMVGAYMEDGPARVIAPALTLSGAAFESFAGGSILLTYLAKNRPGDTLSILDQGDGPGQIGLDGAEITYGGIVVGTMSGGVDGSDLLISLGSAATAEAVQALMRGLTFFHGTSDPGTSSRLLDLIVSDGLGTAAKTTLAVVILPFNNAPLVELAGPPGEAVLAYSENDGPSAIAPSALVADVDSPNFNGGALILSFSEGGGADDRLTILDQGNGAGQIGVAGNIISYEGAAIGTVSGGVGGAPLVILFNASATVAAVQALIRAAAYHNVSDAPSADPRTILFTLTDGDGADAIPISGTIELEPIDDPASAQDDQGSTPENAVLSASVAGNDEDVDGPGPEVVAVNGVAGDVGVEIVLASGALLTLRSDGSYDYDPNHMFDTLGSAASGAANSSATDSFTYTLAGGATATVTITIEGVTSAEDELEGTSGDDVISGGTAADLFLLDDGGDDQATGGLGNDFFYYGAEWTAADLTDGGAGTDTIGLIGNYVLTIGAGSMTGIEKLALYSGLYLPGSGPTGYSITTADANVASGAELLVLGASLQPDEILVFNGSAESDGRFVVHGGGGADTIVGGAGNDFLIGNAGSDLIYGLGGADFLVGGFGADQLRGGQGADTFRYLSGADSVAGGADRILDFQQIDLIDLSAIDADIGTAGNQAFSFIGAAAFTGDAGQLRAFSAGALWMVEADIDGDGVADMVIEVATIDLAALGSADFLL